MPRLIDADRLTRPEIIKMYYHLPNGDTAIPIIDIENAPTIDAVPIKAISAWLAAYAAPPKYAIDEIARTDPERIITVDTLVKAWEYHWKNLMECGLIGEGLDADRS